MNFLELAQETRRLSGVGGTGPQNVELATGMELKIVNYVNNAWFDIQAHPKPWKWMWRDYSIPLVPSGTQPLQTIASTTEYQLTNCDKIRVKTFRSFLTATGVGDRQRMTYMPWSRFRRRYSIVDPLNNRPINVSRKPTGDLVFYPPPNDIYSIEFECFSDPSLMVANGDIPAMPAEFHMLIVYEALKRFGKAENAEEVLALGEAAGGSDGNEGKPVSGLWRALIWNQEFKSPETENEDDPMVVRTEPEGYDY